MNRREFSKGLVVAPLFLAGCNQLIVELLKIVVAAVAGAVIEQSDSTNSPRSSQFCPLSGGDGTINSHLAGGCIELYNHSDVQQVIECSVQLHRADGTPEGPPYDVYDESGLDFPVISPQSEITLRLPNLASTHSGSHYVVATLANGESIKSDLINLQALET